VATIEDSTATVTGGGTSVITATFSPTDSVNFNSANTASTLTVEKATPTFSWSNVLATYSDADFTIVSPAVATTAAAGTWSYSSANTAVIAISSTKFDVGIAGSTVVTATFTPSNTTNYVSGGIITMTVTVQRANQAALLISSTSGTYGTDLALTTTGGTTDATITWGVSNDSATGCAISSGKLVTTSIGTCTVTATMAGNDNYKSVTNSGTTVTINAKPITVTAVAKTKTYGDNDPALTYTTATGALVGSDTLTGTPTRVAGENVGEYTINQGTVANTNYSITYTTAKLTINAKPITVTAVAKTKTYGDNDPALTFTTPTGALVGSDTLTGTPERVAGENVGEYTINQGTVANTNYNITYETAKLTITGKPITVTAVAKTKTYGDNDPSLNYTTPTGALVGQDTLTGSLTRVAGDTVGEYTINQGTVTSTNNTNYDITYVTAKLTITAKPITVTAVAKTKTYGDNDPALNYTTPTGALVGLDTLTGSLTRVAGDTVGEYTINQGTVANSNYNVTFTTAKLTINAKPITVTAVEKTKTYGDNDPSLNYTTPTGALVGQDTLTGSLTRVTGDTVGEYTINQGTVANANYDIAFTAAKLTIEHRLITITADDQTKIYGDNDPALTYEVTNGTLANNNDLTGSLLRAAGEDVGEYTINKGTVAHTNYTISYVSDKLTIGAKPITVTAVAKTKTYGDNDPTFTFTTPTAALVGQDALTGSLTRVTGDTVGEYTINQGTVTNTNNTNYDITYVTAKLTIAAKPITVTATAKTKTYGDNDPALTFTTAVGALVGQDALTGSLTRVTGDTVGEYTINQGTVTNTNNTNYDITYTTAKLTIGAKPITISANAQTKIYGETDPALTITIPTGSLVGSDALTGTSTRVAGEDAGEYTINKGTNAN
jgi:hypothetical protein